MKVQIITDHGTDLPEGFADEHQIKVIPLNLHFEEEEVRSDELTLNEYYEKINQTNILPKTSAPSPETFYQAYKSVPADLPILVLSLSKGLSATFQNAEIGKDMLLEEEPDRDIEVIDTKTASCGVTVLITEALDMNWDDFQASAQEMKQKVDRLNTLFSLDTVENLIKGGRLDKVRGAIAKTLNIKLLMKGENGLIEVTEKVRGQKKALRRLIEQIGDYTSSLSNHTIALAHSNARDKAEQVLGIIRERYQPKREIIVDMGPLISTYAGEGGLVVSFLSEETN